MRFSALHTCAGANRWPRIEHAPCRSQGRPADAQALRLFTARRPVHTTSCFAQPGRVGIPHVNRGTIRRRSWGSSLRSVAPVRGCPAPARRYRPDEPTCRYPGRPYPTDFGRAIGRNASIPDILHTLKGVRCAVDPGRSEPASGFWPRGQAVPHPNAWAGRGRDCLGLCLSQVFGHLRTDAPNRRLDPA